MDMKKILASIIMLACVGTILAQANFKVKVVDKKRIVTGSQEFAKTDREIFANALLWAINSGKQLKENILDCDYEKLSYKMAYNLQQNEGTVYTAQLYIRVAQGRLVYLIEDIKGQSSGVGALLGATSFDRMNPEKKPKQQAMINEFEELSKRAIVSMLESVSSTETNVDQWQAITLGQVVKGMSVSDVTLILGKPIDKQVSGSITQYMYSQFTYVFFEDNKVKSVIQ